VTIKTEIGPELGFSRNLWLGSVNIAESRLVFPTVGIRYTVVCSELWHVLQLQTQW